MEYKTKEKYVLNFLKLFNLNKKNCIIPPYNGIKIKYILIIISNNITLNTYKSAFT